MGPLARRSPLRLARSRVWAVLVAGAFVLLCSATASAPLFAEASGNAALTDQLNSVPANATAGSAPVVRLVGGAGLAGRTRLAGALDAIDGLGAGELTATSLGLEQREGSTDTYTSFIAAGGREERARVFGDDSFARSLVPAPGSTLPGAAPATPAAGALPGIWLPAPVAQRLAVAVGDEVEVGVQTRHERTVTPATIAGVYAVGADGRRPTDPVGVHDWAYRAPFLPSDSEFTTLPAFLLVADVPTVTALAAAIGDDLLYVSEARLSPAEPTLAGATATVAGIHALQVAVRDPRLAGETPDRVHPQVISGLPDLVADASTVADRTVAWTSTLTAAGSGLGLLTVLAVAVLSMVRRAIEVRHAVGVGLRPATVGLLTALEVLPVAVLSAAAGLALAFAVVTAIGPPGAITATSLATGAWRAGVASLAGVAVVAATAGLSAHRAARLTTGTAGSRTLPWELLLAAVAATATAGLYVRPVRAGPPSPLDLIVPVLALAAVGAVGSRLALGLASAARRRRDARGSRGSWSRRPALALAARRVASGGPQTVLVVTILATGLGLLTYSVAAATSVRQIALDRTATLAGASATTDLDASWLVDDGAAQLSPTPTDANEPLPSGPVPGARVPPLPAGTTIVWHGRTTVAPEYTNLDLLVIDPEHFARAASWGSGPELARARALLPELARRDATVTAGLVAHESGAPVPAIGVGELPERRGDTAAVSTDSGDVPITVLDVVPAFPGMADGVPLIVVPADSFFAWLGQEDPRVRPPGGSGEFNRAPRQFFAALWSDSGVAALDEILAPRGIEADNTETIAQVGQLPDLVAAKRSLGLQVALGLCVGAIAMLGLAMYADRAATRSRAPDLLLARVGMGRGGPRRARAAELAVLAGLGLALGFAGVALLAPLGARLLDPGGGSAPAFVLRLDPVSLAVAVGAAIGALAIAIAVANARSARADAQEVLRDAD